MLPAPTVSVIITVFNGGELLPLALNSILQQTFSDFELILVDDGSTDNCTVQVKALNDPRARVIRNPRNLGAPAARNVGIEAAQGLYIAFLDHDDIALPSRLDRQVAFLQSNKSVGLLGSAFDVIDIQGKHIKAIRMLENPLAIRWMGLLECPMRQSSLLGYTRLIKQHRFDPQFPSYQDWEFIMRVARNAEVRNLPDTLIQYRVHNTNMSKVHRARQDEIGIDIALREIRAELPDFPISRVEVAELRHVLLGAGGCGPKKSLQMTRRALDRYLDLQQEFRRKYAAHTAQGIGLVDPLELKQRSCEQFS